MKNFSLIVVYVASRLAILLTLLPVVKQDAILLAASVITVSILSYYDGKNNPWIKQ